MREHKANEYIWQMCKESLEWKAKWHQKRMESSREEWERVCQRTTETFQTPFDRRRRRWCVCIPLTLANTIYIFFLLSRFLWNVCVYWRRVVPCLMFQIRCEIINSILNIHVRVVIIMHNTKMKYSQTCRAAADATLATHAVHALVHLNPKENPRATVRWMHLSSIKCTLHIALGTENISQATHLVCTSCSAAFATVSQSSLCLSSPYISLHWAFRSQKHIEWVTHRWPEFVDRIMMDYAIVQRSIFIEHESPTNRIFCSQLVNIYSPQIT